MISIDLCDGKTTHGNISPERISEFLLAPGDSSDGVQVAPTRSRVARSKASSPKATKASRPILWVDVSSPTEDDWKALEEEFDFHPLAMEDAQKQDQRPKVDTYEGYLFLSVHAWAGTIKPTDDLEAVTHELDIFLGPNYLVTIHNEVNGPIAETRRRLQQNPEHLRNEPGFLLYLLLDALVDEYFPAMDELDTEIDQVEMAIYESNDVPDFKPAVLLKKRLLLLRQAVSPLRDGLGGRLRGVAVHVPRVGARAHRAHGRGPLWCGHRRGDRHDEGHRAGGCPAFARRPPDRLPGRAAIRRDDDFHAPAGDGVRRAFLNDRIRLSAAAIEGMLRPGYDRFTLLSPALVRATTLLVGAGPCATRSVPPQSG